MFPSFCFSDSTLVHCLFQSCASEPNIYSLTNNGICAYSTIISFLIINIYTMASTVAFHSTLLQSHQTLSSSQFLSSNSLILKLKKQTALSTKNLRTHNFQAAPSIFAAQSNFLKGLQTVWRVAKDGVEAGTNLVPDAIPRPIARISVSVVAVTLALFALKSFLSTAFFVLAMMGVIYFAFIAMNKDDGPKGGGGSTPSADDSLEEARRIMEKYK